MEGVASLNTHIYGIFVNDNTIVFLNCTPPSRWLKCDLMHPIKFKKVDKF